MARFEAKNWASNAMVIIRKRAQDSDAFKVARSALVQAVADTVRGKSVPEMRALGGFSQIINEAVEALDTEGIDEDLGSELCPYTVRNELRMTAAFGEIRNRVVMVARR